MTALCKSTIIVAQAIQVENDSSSTPELNKRVLRKIDSRILLIMFITYNLNFIDKTILSSAAVFGLEDDLALVGTQYSWASSMFYFGYLVAEYPATVLVQRLPVSRFLTVVTVSWGLVVALTATCTSFSGLVICRFFLGILESTISPSFVLITSMWYTRDEIPSRTGMWFAGNSLGGFIASLAAYGIGHIEGSVHSWQWLFIIFGVATAIWSLVIMIFLPNTIDVAKFLSIEEKAYTQERIIQSGLGVTNYTTRGWHSSQIKECFLDPKTYALFAISLLTQIPNGGTQAFGNLALVSFGFTSLQSTLITLPASTIAISTIISTGFFASRYKNTTLYLIIFVILPPVIGSSLIYSVQTRSIRLLAYYLLQTGPGAMPLTLSLIASNYRGVTKKMTVTALLFVAYCAGNIAGSQTFKSGEAGTGYPTAFQTILCCYALVIFIALLLRIYLVWVNRRRDNALRGTPDIPNLVTLEDVTDFQVVEFRYRY